VARNRSPPFTALTATDTSGIGGSGPSSPGRADSSSRVVSRIAPAMPRTACPAFFSRYDSIGIGSSSRNSRDPSTMSARSILNPASRVSCVSSVRWYSRYTGNDGQLSDSEPACRRPAIGRPSSAAMRFSIRD
jgi:hypothetical protein